MKKRSLFAALAAAALVFIGVAASINNLNPVPVAWSTDNGTNAFGLDSTARPVITISGTNFSGISTNLLFQREGGTNTLVIKRGIITGVQ